jgi:hypothetical protein
MNITLSLIILNLIRPGLNQSREKSIIKYLVRLNLKAPG